MDDVVTCTCAGEVDPHPFNGGYCGTTVLADNRKEFGYRLSLAPDGKHHVVWWTDYVANDWTEWYESIAVALARVALLIEAEPDQDDDDHTFRWFRQTDAPSFTAAWTANLTPFLEDNT